MNTIMEKLMEKLDIDINGKVRTEALIMTRHIITDSHNTLTQQAAQMEAQIYRRHTSSRSLCMGVATDSSIVGQSREGRVD